MTETVFFISSALNTTTRSIYSNEERFSQTLETVDSIHKYLPNSLIYMFDSSSEVPEEYKLVKLRQNGVEIVYTGDNNTINDCSRMGANSLAESLSFMAFLNWFNSQNIAGDRVYKISGRYHLNDNFVPGFEYKDSFVFKKSVDSWMDDETKNQTGVYKLFDCRLWHMDRSLLKTFSNEMPNIFNDCANLGIDLEHSFYKNLSKYNVVELDKIGLNGYIAPTGEYVDD
jgi:hypothetical protein